MTIHSSERILEKRPSSAKVWVINQNWWRLPIGLHLYGLKHQNSTWGRSRKQTIFIANKGESVGPIISARRFAAVNQERSCSPGAGTAFRASQLAGKKWVQLAIHLDSGRSWPIYHSL